MNNLKLNENFLKNINFQYLLEETSIISITNTKGIITYVNDNFCNISLYNKKELIGKSHNIVRHPDMDKEVFKNLWDTIKLGKVWTGEVKNKKKDGGYYWVYTSIYPLFNKQGIINSYISIRYDITKHRDTIEEELNNKNKLINDLNLLNRERENFVNKIVHDLRTPITIIKGYLQMLLDGDYGCVDENNKEVYNILLSTSNNLLEDVNNILDLAKIRSGNKQVFFNKINLSDFLKEIFLKISQLVNNKNQFLSFPIINKDIIIETDKNKLNSILQNILSNSIKYTNIGGVISFRIELIYNKNNDITDIIFIIKDNGIGISKDKLNSLFKEFYRDGEKVSLIEGTGLGLSIVKENIDILGGNIEVESKEYGINGENGHGTKFKIIIPLKKEK